MVSTIFSHLWSWSEALTRAITCFPASCRLLNVMWEQFCSTAYPNHTWLHTPIPSAHIASAKTYWNHIDLDLVSMCLTFYIHIAGPEMISFLKWQPRNDLFSRWKGPLKHRENTFLKFLFQQHLMSQKADTDSDTDLPSFCSLISSMRSVLVIIPKQLKNNNT